jgi:5'-nucleotidase
MRYFHKPRLPRSLFAVWATLALIGLTACGGGSDDNVAPPAPPVPSASLTLTGSAATGGAIVAAPITVKCSTGEGNGMTSGDGTFSIAETLTAGGTRLHSVAVGSASAVVVNITPLTELVVASNVGMAPAAYFAGFDASSAATLTSSSVSAAQSVVIAILKAAGIDLSTIGDLISTALKASTSTTTGDAYDHALDGFATALASSGTTLTTFTTAVIGSTGAPEASARSLSPIHE